MQRLGAAVLGLLQPEAKVSATAAVRIDTFIELPMVKTPSV
ncbi:MAG: hypothetical protein NTV94_10855 [Planctomycetota bacterium]|nr:hypothetical protein [Planctomycetota bacterium]